MRRLLSLWLPDFSCERLARRSSAPAEVPFALLRAEHGRLLLSAVNGEAQALGLTPSQPLAAARALVPELVTQPEEPAADRATLQRLFDWCQRYTPWVAMDPAAAVSGEEQSEESWGGDAALWLDITGCAHLFGGEAALAEDLLARLAASGFTARVGVAATPGAAWALARHATDPAHPSAVLAPEAELSRSLAGLPVAALRLPAATRELLRRLGLDQVGQLYNLPPATLAPRFGHLLAQRLRQALGTLAESIGPERPSEPLWVRRAFAEPISTPEDLDRALAWLAEELATLLGRRGLGARRLELTGHRVDGTATRIAIGLGRPNRDPRHWRRLFQPKQERLDPGFGIEVVTLAATQADVLAAEQTSLGMARSGPKVSGQVLPLPRKAPAPEPEPLSQGSLPLTALPPAPSAPRATTTVMTTELAALVDRLENRLGQESVRRLDPLERHWPEDAVEAAAPGAPRPDDRPTWASPRPLYLLRRPEPVEGVTLGAEQAPSRFTWRRRQLAIEQAEGPERITPAWWQPGRAAEAPRDYWRVEDQEGRRYWLYREGAANAPRWFVHGLFA